MNAKQRLFFFLSILLFTAEIRADSEDKISEDDDPDFRPSLTIYDGPRCKGNVLATGPCDRCLHWEGKIKVLSYQFHGNSSYCFRLSDRNDCAKSRNYFGGTMDRNECGDVTNIYVNHGICYLNKDTR
ncbi:unnamed protein product [Bursaphelenchus xylophilus]|uniref:(pine wood nematode) hypothetical protein n=1 Tax=Bursaphelenchus xylophilus TaxID=6326 RepID=A0A1I7RXB4_BURXY|nr:unnamed protein product [Bursaphelenchus xylophilus]CAG9121516.1 unnamed protein product [Bursaphelenchus xylophilus]